MLPIQFHLLNNFWNVLLLDADSTVIPAFHKNVRTVDHTTSQELRMMQDILTRPVDINFCQSEL